jgi:putative oxidoreductase
MRAVNRPGVPHVDRENWLPPHGHGTTMNMQLPPASAVRVGAAPVRQLGEQMSVGRLTARVVIGGLVIGHGTQKLFGWFGGPGRAGTEAMMESLDLRPGKVHALAAGLTETVSGALLAAGLATPAAAAGITGVMTTAIAKVHWPNGPWVAKGGWEYNVVLIAAVTALADTGPGDLSLDHALGVERRGWQWALAALASGVGAAALTMAAGGRGRAGGSSPTAAIPETDTGGDTTTSGA